MPKLSAAQIENRRYSIYIKRLAIESAEKNSEETQHVKEQLMLSLKQFGEITHVSVDGGRKTAIVRFRKIASAEACYRASRETDEDGRRIGGIFSEPHTDAQIVYVIPEQPEGYDLLKDDSLTLEQITKMIKDKNDEVKQIFKKFCSAESDQKEEL